MCNRTQNDAIWGLITLFLTNQIAGNTSDFKMNVITSEIFYCCYVAVIEHCCELEYLVKGFLLLLKIDAFQFLKPFFLCPQSKFARLFNSDSCTIFRFELCTYFVPCINAVSTIKRPQLRKSTFIMKSFSCKMLSFYPDKVWFFSNYLDKPLERV